MSSTLRRLLNPVYQLATRQMRRRVRGSSNRVVVGSKRYRNCFLEVLGDENQIEFGEGTELVDVSVLIIGSRNRLVVGANCTWTGRFELVGNGCSITVGEDSTSNGSIVGAFEDGSVVTIGADCMLSAHIDIRTSDSHPFYDAERRRLNPPENVSVGNHVWIGQRVLVLKGVTIGDGAVVGAGSIVTKSVAPRTVVAGSPARVLRENVRWDRELPTS